MLSNEQVQNIPLELPQELPTPPEHLPLINHEMSGFDKRKAEICGLAAALACLHAGYADVQVTADVLQSQAAAVVETMTTPTSNVIDIHDLVAHPNPTKDTHHDKQVDPPDFTDLERKLEENDGQQPPFETHFRDRQYKHGTSRRPKSRLFRH